MKTKSKSLTLFDQIMIRIILLGLTISVIWAGFTMLTNPTPRTPGIDTSALKSLMGDANESNATQSTQEENTAVYAPIPATDHSTTNQAQAIYDDSPQKVDDCLRAKVEGRRTSPACHDIIKALGQGR